MLFENTKRRPWTQTVCLILPLLCCHHCLADSATWDVKEVAKSGSRTCRRPMATGVYDAKTQKVYACWSGPSMQPQVAAIDPSSGKVLQVKALKIPDKSQDFHDYPHIIQSADGVLHVFYSRHNRSLFQITAPSPNTIDGEWTAREIGSGLRATYPMPISDSKGTMYVFYRVTKGGDYRPMAYVKSTDNGNTWSKPVKAIDHEKTRRKDHLDEIYIGALTPASPKGLGEVFHCTWTIAGGGPERHDHDDYHKNVYHAYFRPSDGHWLSADGTDLGSLIDDTVAEKHCKVFDSGALYGIKRKREPMDIGYITKAVSGPDGHPIVLFQDGKRKSVAMGRWTGTEWSVSAPEGLNKHQRFMDVYVGPDGKQLFVMLPAKAGTIETLVSTGDYKTWIPHNKVTVAASSARSTAIITPHTALQLVQERCRDYKGTGRVWIAIEN